MSKWMISHASAYIITPILSSLLLGLVVSIYSGSFVEFGFGIAIVSYMFYLFLLIPVVVMLVLFFIRKKESVQSNLLLLIILSIIGGLISGNNAVVVAIYYAMTSIIYVIIQFIISKVLVPRFNIHDEFLNKDSI